MKLSKMIILCFALLFSFGCKGQDNAKEVGFMSLFDGKTLDGWLGDDLYWKVKEGTICGEITSETLIDRNRFLIYQGDVPSDFELIVEYKISMNGNSGVNYRSEVVDGIDFHALKGYQCDIDGSNNYTGSNYEERIRTTLAKIGERTVIPSIEGSESLKYKEDNLWVVREVVESLGSKDDLTRHIKDEQWNEVHIVVKGNSMKHYVNDILMSEVIDNDTANKRINGKIGIQVHVGPPMTIQYKNIRLKDLTKKAKE